jgi:outer membrane protein assembly factor BamB
VLFDGLLILACDGTDRQYVAALDAATGETRWKSDRPTAMAYATPLVIEVGKQAQLISPGAMRTMAYNPRTGREIWRVNYGDGFSNVPRPVYAHGLVYLCTGFYGANLLAVRADGAGDVTRSHIAWSTNRNVPYISSPIVVGNELYMVNDNGIASCLDAKTGAARWQQRLPGPHAASTVYAGGHIYFLSEEGEATVIQPGTSFQRVASNRLDGQFLASPAISSGSIFLRSQTHLYRISTLRGQ